MNRYSVLPVGYCSLTAIQIQNTNEWKWRKKKEERTFRDILWKNTENENKKKRNKKNKK